MEHDSSLTAKRGPAELNAFLQRALLLDLEVSHQGAFLKLGAVLGEATLARFGSTPIEALATGLDSLAERATCILGHNLVRHDLPILRERSPSLAINRLPAIDTLVLSPLCFPENPYHRLVKDYKLVRESVNDPVADARQAALLFGDEFRSLEGLRQTEPALFGLLHFLLATADGQGDQPAYGMELVFRALGGTRPTKPRVLEICRELFGRWACILVCCFNRHAAIELRRRLRDLVDDDAKGVTVLTYHGLAMRLLGHSFAGRAEKNPAAFDFDALITDAVKLLRGETVPPGVEPDEVRDRLLAGFQFILVDEYQDIDQPQYEMISAIAGKPLEDPDLKMSILAVGDDDQNIYAFRGTNVEFIRRFKQDYDAEVHYLVENYRSTGYIIEAANRLIAANTDRMKTKQPIQIDRHREMFPAGGEFGQRDPATKGKVQVIRVSGGHAQAQAVIAEILRLRELGAREWSQIAVLSSTHRELAQVRALAETSAIPIRWVAQRDKMVPLHQLREIRRFLRRLEANHNELKRASELKARPPISARCVDRPGDYALRVR